MRRTFAFLTAAVISLWTLKPAIAAPSVGDRLSLSITNKYGDVLTNPTVAQILGDGLILQRGAMEWKVKYQDLPPDIAKKYHPLAAGIIKKEEKADAANAAYLAYSHQLETEQSRQLAAQAAQENEQAADRTKNQTPTPNEYLIIPIPNQNWKLTILNLGFRDWKKQEDHGQFILHGLPGPSGFNFVLFVENPANNLPGNDPVYNFFWLNMAHNSLIDADSVKVERREKFIKVFYTAHGQPNVNYFFAYQGKWVDAHLSKPSFEPGDEKLVAAFDKGFSYGQ